MSLLWHILAQFLFRLSFGIALAMGGTSPRLVTSGFYRIQMWVLLGLNTFASLIIWSHATGSLTGLVIGLAISSTLVCYLGAVCWLYEKPRPGMVAVWLVAALGLMAALVASFTSQAASEAHFLAHTLRAADVLSGGLLLGFTTAAMLLGHWYLNAPGMQLAPLRRLVAAMTVATLLRALVVGAGLGLTLSVAQDPLPSFWFLLLRWLSGIVGTLIVAAMTWQTLRIPNTQSATGILYVGVIVVFLGELAAMLLSAGNPYPL